MDYALTPANGDPYTLEPRVWRRKCNWSIEERCFNMTLMMFESHFSNKPPIGPKTMKKSTEMIQDTLRRSLEKPDIRYAGDDEEVRYFSRREMLIIATEKRELYAKNVDVWMRLRLTLQAAHPVLSRRSLREAYAETAPQNTDIPESSTLIAENRASLAMDLTLINTLLLLARNMLAIKQVAQDLCAAVQFDRQVIKLIALCVNVTSKGYDGENVDPSTREKLNEVTELYKKVLMSCLQVVHNLTMGNDRQKMAFCLDMLFDHEMSPEVPGEGLNVDVVYEEVLTWLRHDKSRSSLATELLIKYAEEVELGNTAGPLPDETMDELFPDDDEEVPAQILEGETKEDHSSELQESGTESKNAYFRVSREIDDWWMRVRDANYDGWVVPMETVEGAQRLAQACRENGMDRYFPSGAEHDSGVEYENGDLYGEDPSAAEVDNEELENGSMGVDDGQDEEGDEGEDEDDDSYVEGPLRGLLTEVPNILDAKQIEALHMTVKACIVDSMGSGLTESGENLQRTRCKMFLALDCGKNLLREMLVFIAVWDESEDKFIFQITAQIIEAFHHNALLPYAWNSLRIMKDIVSPAQTVLLRLINYMFRARKESKVYNTKLEAERDAKLIHFLFNYFRTRVVPDCLTLIHLQADIRANHASPTEFPVDVWDMERAKDGLSQYLDFLLVIAQIPEMRKLLVKWEAVYELITLLNALWAGVDRKSFDDRNSALDHQHVSAGMSNLSVGNNGGQQQIPPPPPPPPPQPTLPPLHDAPHKFPWSGVKTSILEILSYLVGQPFPPPPSSDEDPNNPNSPENNGNNDAAAAQVQTYGASADRIVQEQILKYEGVDAVLMCCCYDGWNELGRQRAELCLKFICMGNLEAQGLIGSLREVGVEEDIMGVKGGNGQGNGGKGKGKGKENGVRVDV